MQTETTIGMFMTITCVLSTDQAREVFYPTIVLDLVTNHQTVYMTGFNIFSYTQGIGISNFILSIYFFLLR